MIKTQEMLDRAKRKVKEATQRIAAQEIESCQDPYNCGQGGNECKACIEAFTIQEARDELAINEMKEMGYECVYNPPPIPMRNCDWQFCHTDYDGPGDMRCGCGSCPEMCLERVKEIAIEWGDLD